MMLRRIYHWIRKTYALLLLLAAWAGVHPGKPLPIPGMPPAPPVATPAPAPAVPAPPAKRVIGQCATGDLYQGAKRVGFNAVCVVDGTTYVLPPPTPTGFPTRTAAQQAIRDFRAANA